MKRTIARLLYLLIVASLSTTPAWAAKKGKDKDGKETTVTLAEVPAAVQTAIEDESRGAEVKKIEKSTKKGKVIYELEIIKARQQYEILISEEGSVLKRKAEKPGQD
jgi:uncharacterized membrane protein YkoI